MTNKYFVIKILILFAGLSCISVYASTKEIFNTPAAVSAPSTERLILYSLNAKRGMLIKENSSKYKLILYDVHEVINYSISNKTENSELINTTNFINKWQKIKDAKIEADIAGIQVNKKIFGHTEFYATVLLKQPRYKKDSDEISFMLIPIKPPINLKNKIAVFENVTIYLNGCDFCDCYKNSSLKNCM